MTDPINERPAFPTPPRGLPVAVTTWAGDLIRTMTQIAGEANPRMNDVIRKSNEEIRITDHGARTDGSDASPGFQRALEAVIAAGGGLLRLPPGDVLLNSQVVASAAGLNIAIVGAGPEVTRLIVPASNTTGGFAITSTDKASQVTLRDFSMLADGKQLGTGIKIALPTTAGNRHNRSVYMNRVEIKGIDVTEDCFTTMLDLTGCWRPALDGVVVGGPFGPGVTGNWTDASAHFFATLGIDLDDCYHPELNNCYVWSAVTGISCVSSGGEAEEGFRMRNTNIVGVKTALKWTRAAQEPTLWITNCHWTYRDVGLDISGAKFITITGCVPFNQDVDTEFSGTPVDIHLKDTAVTHIHHNAFHFDGHPTKRVNIHLDTATAGKDLIVAHNFFNAKADVAVKIGSGATNVLLDGNYYPGTITTEVDDASGKAVIIGPTASNKWTIESQDDGAANFPVLELYRRSTSPAPDDKLGALILSGQNDASPTPAKIDYVTVRGLIIDETDGTEDSALQIFTQAGGAVGLRWDLRAAVVDDDTALLLQYKPGSGGATVQRVSVGTTDSGGTNFRLLRVPN